jgi:hypothetical protein
MGDLSLLLLYLIEIENIMRSVGIVSTNSSHLINEQNATMTILPYSFLLTLFSSFLYSYVHIVGFDCCKDRLGLNVCFAMERL